MEIGHNVMHGQYDWMNDQALNSKTYEWDNACESKSWARTHNFIHHTYNNILGKDKDIGYGVMRINEKQEWKPRHVFQILHSFLLASFFEWGVGLHEMQADEIRDGKVKLKDKFPILKSFIKKASRQFFKDYVFFPILTGPALIPTLFANMTANLARNLWSSAVIFCGHFPDGTHVFTEHECKNESQGHWYYRQILGSANFSGGKLIHLMSGHLSFQIEHHLFPDVPAHRYQEMAPKVKKVCEKYGISYNSGPFLKQYMTVLKKIHLHSSPQMKSS